jgi:hypothetical protein
MMKVVDKKIKKVFAGEITVNLDAEDLVALYTASFRIGGEPGKSYRKVFEKIQKMVSSDQDLREMIELDIKEKTGVDIEIKENHCSNILELLDLLCYKYGERGILFKNFNL